MRQAAFKGDEWLVEGGEGSDRSANMGARDIVTGGSRIPGASTM
jgi:hypothetical protein